MFHRSNLRFTTPQVHTHTYPGYKMAKHANNTFASVPNNSTLIAPDERTGFIKSSE